MACRATCPSAVFLLALLGLVPSPRPAAAEEAVAPPPAAAEAVAGRASWRDPTYLAPRFAQACDAVETACGATFRRRPTLRISTRAEVKEVLREEIAPRLEALGLAGAVESTLALLSVAAVGKYALGTHVVHLVPENAEFLARHMGDDALLSADVLRVTLAHEVTHALDFERFPLEATLKARATVDGQQAVSSVVEGHAQWVAEAVASSWGIPDAFARFTRTITYVPPLPNEALRRAVAAVVAEVSFAYVQGHAFVAAVARARGREGVEAVLREPPADPEPIEHPDRFLAPPDASGRPDLAAALETLRPLVGDPRWQVVATRISEATLRTQASAVPADLRDEFLRGFEDARALVGTLAAEDRQTVAMLLLFRDEAAARRYADLERASADAGEASAAASGIEVLSSRTTTGAGADGALHGFAAKKRLRAQGKEVDLEVQTFATGRVAGSILVVGSPEIDRGVQDAAIERIAAYLADPKAYALRPRPDPVPLVPRPR